MIFRKFMEGLALNLFNYVSTSRDGMFSSVSCIHVVGLLYHVFSQVLFWVLLFVSNMLLVTCRHSFYS